MAADYRHEPLAQDKDQFRLLEFDFTGEREISTKLHTFDLNDKLPPYQALSYVWGPKEPKQRISIDIDRKFSVRQNLFDFLEIFVRKAEIQSRYIWIDQLCIDQNSTLERNHRVQLMGKIFEGAKRVILWPGTYTNSGVEALFDRLRDVPPLPKSDLPISDAEKEVWRGMLRVSYWTRHWVIQEICLAQSSLVVYGEHTLPFEALIGIWPEWMQYSERYPGVGEQVHVLYFWNMRWNMMATENADKSFTVPSTIPRTSLLALFKLNTQCEDPRDKVYGVLNILPHYVRFPVDYSKSVHEVFELASDRWRGGTGLNGLNKGILRHLGEAMGVWLG